MDEADDDVGAYTGRFGDDVAGNKLDDEDVGRKADLLDPDAVTNKLLPTILVLFDVIVGISSALLVGMIPDDDE